MLSPLGSSEAYVGLVSAERDRSRRPRHRLPQAYRVDLGQGRFAEGRPRQDSNLRIRLRRPTLYPLSYEGGLSEDSGIASPPAHSPAGSSRASRWGSASQSRHNGRRMADPLIIASDRLAPAFAAVAGPGAGVVDPIVRPSDRADAQANGVLGLAKQLGRPRARWPPRSSPPLVRSMTSASSRSPARAFSTSPSPTPSSAPPWLPSAQTTGSASGRRRSPRPSSSTTRRRTSPRRCTSVICAPR